MSNLSVFEKNCVRAFRGAASSEVRADEAEALFLKHGGGLNAERDALDFLAFHEVSDGLIDLAAKLYVDFDSRELKSFVRDTAYRHAHGNPTTTPWPHWRGGLSGEFMAE